MAFWLNVRNLAVVLSLLTKGSEPMSLEEWTSCLQLSLFVRRQALSRPALAWPWALRGPADIDHGILGHGLLPRPKRLKEDLPELQEVLKPWPCFGLWLPIRFGAPELRCFRSQQLLPQLRAAAEELLETCKAWSMSMRVLRCFQHAFSMLFACFLLVIAYVAGNMVCVLLSFFMLA